MPFPYLRLALSLGVLALSGCQLLVETDRDDIGGPDKFPGDHDQDQDPSTETDASTPDGDDDDGDEDACDKLVCEPGSHCELSDCAGSACGNEPIAACVPDEDGGDGDGDGDQDESSDEDDGPPPPTCASVVCPVGTACVDTDQGPKCIPPQENPCNDKECPEGQTCEIKDGEAVCIGGGESCNGMTCDEGTSCARTDDGEMCVPDEDNPCLDKECAPNQVCELDDGRAECVTIDPCDDFECDAGQHCELLLPPCAPPHDPTIDPVCMPEPACVPDASCETIDCGPKHYCDDSSGTVQCIPLPTCEGFPCDDGYECELVDVACVVEPCFKQPACVWVGLPCGNDLCEQDEYCAKWGNTHYCAQGTPCGENLCQLGQVCCAECGECVKAGKPCNDVCE